MSVTTKTFIRRYWRVPVVALLGALIAFGGSFLIQETYASSTRILIRGRDTTFLTTSGQPISSQSGLIDAGMAKSLAETYAGTATSREVATMVVDELGLDQPKPEETGPVAWMAKAVATTYKCGRAFITYGFCADPEPREKAIQGVQEGLIAAQLGPETGAAAGQANSYIVEIAGSGETPQEARDVTNAAADATIQVSANRTRQDAETYATSLGVQVEAADGAVDLAAREVSDFQVAHGITDLDQQKVAAVSTATETQNQLAETQDQLAGARNELASLDATLAGIDPKTTTNERITTGRSETGRETDATNPLFNELSAQRALTAAKIAELEGTEASLSSRLAGGSPDATALTEDQADLLQLEQKLSQAQTNFDKLTEEHQAALVNVEATSVELTRMDEASTPTYPEAPKKYLYLALGLLIGGLAGGGLTWLARRRELTDEDDETGGAARRYDADGYALDLRAEAMPVDGDGGRVPVGAGAPAGSSLFSRSGGEGPGNGHGPTNGNGNGNGYGHPSAPEGQAAPRAEGELESP
jgi:uncharacterized protein involved in exopolysaccharide biosynthesis